MSAKNCDRYKDKIILAPMVKIGTLPSRLLALEYGADLVYTEEIIDWRILRSKRVVNDVLRTIEYIDQTDGSVVFSTCEQEKNNLILQMGTSDEKRALEVLLRVQNDISGIDVNMGCPKEFSIKGGMGAALLSKPDKVKAILTTLVNSAKIPVTCKIRVLSTIEKTLELALLIQSCGVSALAIHGRNINERPQDLNRNHFIKAIAEKMDIPIIANGGSKEIDTYSDIFKFKEETGASSVMLARAAEWNPSIFRKEGKLDGRKVLLEYLKLAVITDNSFTNTKYTIHRMLKDQVESPIGKRFLAAMTMEDICETWGLLDFYNQRRSEWEEHRRKRSATTQLELDKVSEAKRTKVDLQFDDSVIVVPDCAFIRGHYNSNEDLPKSKLLKWIRSQTTKFDPIYKTEVSDKRFISVVQIEDRKLRTDVWEKSKKYAEQGAALAACRYLKLL